MAATSRGRQSRSGWHGTRLFTPWLSSRSMRAGASPLTLSQSLTCACPKVYKRCKCCRCTCNRRRPCLLQWVYGLRQLTGVCGCAAAVQSAEGHHVLALGRRRRHHQRGRGRQCAHAGLLQFGVPGEPRRLPVVLSPVLKHPVTSMACPGLLFRAWSGHAQLSKGLLDCLADVTRHS